MIAGYVAPAVSAAVAGAVLTFGTFGVLDAGGPAGREEATVESRGRHVSNSGHQYDLVLRTASGERFEVSSPQADLDLEPGVPVRLDVSKVGRSVQAVEAGGHRVEVGNSAVGLGVFAVVITAMLLFFALIIVAEAGRPALAALSMTAGFVVGALPVVLLF